MSLWTRIVNALRPAPLDRALDQEFDVHIHEAIAGGRGEEEARRSIGNRLHARERSRDVKVLGWLEALVADTTFGARQLRRNWVISSAAIVSLALAIGACTGAFRLIDAVLLRPLPVAEPDRLFYLTSTVLNGSEEAHEGVSFPYPVYRKMRNAVAGDADLLAVSWSGATDITYAADAELEKVFRQYVSGNMFQVFGLRPALGRLLSPADDSQPGGHAVAVLSYNYWAARFGRDLQVIGRTFHSADQIYQIVGVAPKGFTGTQTGTFTGIFVPTAMNGGLIDADDSNWLRIFVRPKPAASPDALRDRLQAVYTADHRDRIKDMFITAERQERVDAYLKSRILIHPALAGVSETQTDYRRALLILGALVALVLLIAAANVANLLTAQAAARSREMALRVAIGAGRTRLVQLVLVESAILALAATLLGGLFAWWSAPWVTSCVNPPDNPLQLALPADWRVLGFAAALAVAVTLLFGLAPALRASAVKPAAALKGSDDPHSRHRLIYGLIVAQVAFCFVVNFAAGLFVATSRRLSQQPTGFTAAGVLLLSTSVNHDAKRTVADWTQIEDRLKSLPQVESVALSGWPLLSGGGWDSSVRLPGSPVDSIEPFFLRVSPGFLSAMRIRLIAGRNFTPADLTGVAIVTRSFARRYFGNDHPLGRVFERAQGKFIREQIVGVIDDVRYENLREPLHPVVFLPSEDMSWATFEVRTAAANPASLASLLRAEVPRVHPEFRVTGINTETDLVNQWTIRERLLSALSLFFAIVALLLAGIGLYGVLNYSVQQRTREIGIRMALGARAPQVAWHIAVRIFGRIAIGIAAGLLAGLGSRRLLSSLLYSVKTTEAAIIALPLICLLVAASAAALPPILRAIRIDPSQALRSE